MKYGWIENFCHPRRLNILGTGIIDDVEKEVVLYEKTEHGILQPWLKKPVERALENGWIEVKYLTQIMANGSEYEGVLPELCKKFLPDYKDNPPKSHLNAWHRLFLIWTANKNEGSGILKVRRVHSVDYVELSEFKNSRILLGRPLPSILAERGKGANTVIERDQTTEQKIWDTHIAPIVKKHNLERANGRPFEYCHVEKQLTFSNVDPKLGGFGFGQQYSGETWWRNWWRLKSYGSFQRKLLPIKFITGI